MKILVTSKNVPKISYAAEGEGLSVITTKLNKARGRKWSHKKDSEVVRQGFFLQFPEEENNAYVEVGKYTFPIRGNSLTLSSGDLEKCF